MSRASAPWDTFAHGGSIATGPTAASVLRAARRHGPGLACMALGGFAPAGGGGGRSHSPGGPDRPRNRVHLPAMGRQFTASATALRRPIAPCMGVGKRPFLPNLLLAPAFPLGKRARPVRRRTRQDRCRADSRLLLQSRLLDAMACAPRRGGHSHCHREPGADFRQHRRLRAHAGRCDFHDASGDRQGARRRVPQHGGPGLPRMVACQWSVRRRRARHHDRNAAPRHVARALQPAAKRAANPPPKTPSPGPPAKPSTTI